MECLKKGIWIWMIIFLLLSGFDYSMFALTNGDFPIEKTALFGVIVTAVVFLFMFSPPKFKKRKRFVTALNSAKRVQRK